MKNILTSIPFISLIIALFCLNNAVDQQAISTSDFLAGNNSSRTFGVETGRANTPEQSRFSWQPVKTAVIPFGKSLDLSGSYVLSDSSAGDVSWVADGRSYAALKPMKVQFCILGIVDIKTITTNYLNTLKFNSNLVSSAPVPSLSYPNNLTANTVIACKTPAGKYYLLEIARVDWGMYWDVQLSVYHGTYEIV